MALPPQHIMPAQMVAPAGFTATLMQQHMSGEMVLKAHLMFWLGTRNMTCHVNTQNHSLLQLAATMFFQRITCLEMISAQNALSQLHKARK
jgi:hypothetical protein